MTGFASGFGGRAGFALVVVLSTLSIIALLFAISSSRILSGAGQTATESRLAQRGFLERELLDLAVASFGDGEGRIDAADVLNVRLNGNNVVVRLRDAGGRIDLNTAAPELLEHLARSLDLEPGMLDAYRAWRRTPHRLLRVSDFARISGAGPAAIDRLKRAATVYSGRRGISPEHATFEVLRLVSGGDGGRDLLPSQVPEEWRTPPSGAIFDVYLERSGMPEQRIGTIRLGPSGKVLAAG